MRFTFDNSTRCRDRGDQSTRSPNGNRCRGRRWKLLAILMPLLLLPYLPIAGAQTNETGDAAASRSGQTEDVQIIRRLQAIRESLQNKREQVRNLVEEVQRADETLRHDLGLRIAALQQEIRELSAAFERTAAGGLTLQTDADADAVTLDWHEELLQIARPILDSLKKATERPRRIAELQAAIEFQQQQLARARQALDSLSRFEDRELPTEVEAGIGEVTAAWRRHLQDIEQALQIERNELQYLQSQDARMFENMGGITYDFILGRGLTLLLALLAGIALWIALRMLRRWISRGWRAARGSGQSAQVRLLFYSYHLLTVVLVTLAVLSVFYLRGDLLLLSLAIVALVMLALGVWRFLPGYVEEARLLLNAGSARQGERVVYNGIPMRIESLNLYSELRNPDLEGRLRLPLAALAGLTSRPAHDEPWFPCRPGDYLLLANGDFAEVLRQTVELVQLRVLGSLVQYDSAAFLQASARNLSRDGFGVAVTFGIDYRHQPDALARVPERIRAGVEDDVAQAGFDDHLQSLVVEFKAAAASSLDYLVYATFDGAAAASYFRIGRLIQQSCVKTCNREGWTIPFAQLTVHRAADGASGGDADVAAAT